MKKQRDTRNVLMVAASEQDANLYYATGFLAPDPIIYVQAAGKKHLLMNDLEVDRARKQSTVDKVHSLSDLARKHMKKTGRRPGYVDIITDFLKSKRVKKITVPGNFPLEYADALRGRKFKITTEGDPFYEQRTIKTPKEVKAIEHAIRCVEKAVEKGIQALRESKVKKGKLYLGGTVFTSERLRKIINVSLMEDDCIAQHSIVSCGKHAVDPHDEGSGPLYANQSIIMDIFPRHGISRYHADFTRTVVKGKASAQLTKMYNAVREGQEIAFRQLKDGVDAGKIHKEIHDYFESLGFKTGLINGRMQGFFHGTGHGLGLDIHEQPRFGGVKEIMRAGHVVTVEPGLYYEGLGGVRLEDVVVITKTGNRNLTKYPKFLEIK